MLVFPAPRNPVKTVIGIEEDMEAVNKPTAAWGYCRGRLFQISLVIGHDVPRGPQSGLLLVFCSLFVEWARLPAWAPTIMSVAHSTSYSKHNPSPGVVIRASRIARAHTILAYSAFGSALVLGLLLHYKKIVKNGVAGYPQEWFPSVSAT